MLKKVLQACVEGKTLNEKEAKETMDTIMSGEATSSQIASLLSILRMRGETIDELTGFARSMQEHALTIMHDEPFLIDTCGTGGDGANTFNISTATAIGLSACDLKVAKHGNRAVSSKSGSADVLEALGLEIQSTPKEAVDALKTKGMAFLFAPLYHVAMKHAVTPRNEIGFRTIFNLLGPLTNPARAHAQIIGVFDASYGKKMAETIRRLGSTRALFVTGSDGLDEITVTGKTYVTELKNGTIEQYEMIPEAVGSTTYPIDGLKASGANESAQMIQGIFEGKVNGAPKEIVLMNMAAGLYLANKADSWKEGYFLAKEALSNGIILSQLERLRKVNVS